MDKSLLLVKGAALEKFIRVAEIEIFTDSFGIFFFSFPFLPSICFEISESDYIQNNRPSEDRAAQTKRRPSTEFKPR